MIPLPHLLRLKQRVDEPDENLLIGSAFGIEIQTIVIGRQTSMVILSDNADVLNVAVVHTA